MNQYRISYVLTTYNKLPYLRHVMKRLVAEVQDDEEIIVCDGGSTDGTPAFLQELYDAGKIHQFVSERDKGESHGNNKGMLRARGEVIKLLTDDDAFSYPAIRQAAVFMLAHPKIDVLTGETWLLDLEDLRSISFCQWSLDHYESWLRHGIPGTMIGLSWLIRRASLPLTGLYHTGVVQVDGEFSFRITSLNVNIAWMNQLVSIRIENPQSNARNMSQQAIDDEVERMLYFYDRRKQHDMMHYLRTKSGLVRTLKKPLRPLKKALQSFREPTTPTSRADIPTHYTVSEGEDRLTAAFALCDQFMTHYNGNRPVEFMSPTTGRLA